MKNLLDIWNGITTILSGIISIIALIFLPFIFLQKYINKMLKRNDLNNKKENLIPIELIEKKGGD